LPKEIYLCIFNGADLLIVGIVEPEAVRTVCIFKLRCANAVLADNGAQAGERDIEAGMCALAA
jgi:hypothetical protein